MSRTFAGSLSRAYLDVTYGSRKRSLSTADLVTHSLAKQMIAPGGTGPGRELLRRGYGNNVANAVAQGWTDSFFSKRR